MRSIKNPLRSGFFALNETLQAAPGKGELWNDYSSLWENNGFDIVVCRPVPALKSNETISRIYQPFPPDRQFSKTDEIKAPS